MVRLVVALNPQVHLEGDRENAGFGRRAAANSRGSLRSREVTNCFMALHITIGTSYKHNLVKGTVTFIMGQPKVKEKMKSEEQRKRKGQCCKNIYSEAVEGAL